ncbi:MAG: hypothetical protein ACP5NS_02425 [Candidatus Pacearchaeota archaeon]
MAHQIQRFFESLIALIFLVVFAGAFLPLIFELGGQNRVVLVVISAIGIVISFIGIIASIIASMHIRRIR